MRPESLIRESAPIDVQELLERCMGNIDLAERVLIKLQSRFDEDLKELEDALAANNGKLVASAAHRLKGAASNVAAHDLHRCASTIEELVRAERWESLPAHLDTLRNQWSRVNHFGLSDVKLEVAQPGSSQS